MEALKSAQNEYLGTLARVLRYIETSQRDQQMSEYGEWKELNRYLSNFPVSSLSSIVNYISHLTSGTRYDIANDDLHGAEKVVFEEIKEILHNLTLLSTSHDITSSFGFGALEHSHNTSSSTSDHDQLFFPTFDFAISGVATLVIGTIGLISNIVGIVFVSSGSRKGKLFNLLLASLFTSDAIFLRFMLLRCIDLFFLPIRASYPHTFHTVVGSGVRFSMTSSVLFLVATAHSRLVVIKWPLQNQGRDISVNETRNKFRRYWLPIIFMSAIITSPLYWETEEDISQMKNGAATLVPSALRSSPIYSIFYMGILNLGLLGIFPLISLIYCNYYIIKELKKNSRRLSNSPINRNDQQKGVMQSLIFIIFAFIFLHLLRIFNIVGEIIILTSQNKEVSGTNNEYGVPTFYYFTCSISEFFMTTYATINVMIYLYPKLSTHINKWSEQTRLNCSVELEEQNINNLKDVIADSPRIDVFVGGIEQRAANNSEMNIPTTTLVNYNEICSVVNCKFCSIPSVEKLI